MRLAYIIYQGAVIGGRSNGIRSQALTWKRLLESVGHEVVLVNNWEHYNWDRFDAIHIFGYDISLEAFVHSLSKRNQNICISPIIDSNKNKYLYKFASYWGIKQLRLYSSNYALRFGLKYAKAVCVRSNHELLFVEESLNISSDRIIKIPLSYDVEPPSSLNLILNNKENFCLHVSSIYQPRKNVVRLINAANKYKFKLVLVGNKGKDCEFEPLEKAIGDNDNIKVLGFVDHSTLLKLYERAKVFALPSTNEGVGIVALDAAIYGCNIVMTNIGAPKEYYHDSKNIRLIDPYSIDEIGFAIQELMQVKPDSSLSSFIEKTYSQKKVLSLLIEMYTQLKSK